MRYVIGFSAVLAMAAALFVLLGAETTKPLEKAPDAELYLLNEQPKMLSGFAGKPIILHFWATWCAPCVEEFPRLLAIIEAHPEWQFILLSADEKEGALAPFLQKMEASSGMTLSSLPNLTLAWDRDKHLSQEIFQTVSYPETLVIGPDLTLRDKIVGPISARQLEALLPEASR